MTIEIGYTQNLSYNDIITKRNYRILRIEVIQEKQIKTEEVRKKKQIIIIINWG